MTTEMKPSHAPKPWRLGAKDHNDQRTLVAEDGRLIAVFAHECLTSREPEMEANARLAAAAPMMLAALKAVYDHNDKATWAQMAAAIAKAEKGTTP